MDVIFQFSNVYSFVASFVALRGLPLFVRFLWLDDLLGNTRIITFGVFESLFFNLLLIISWQSRSHMSLGLCGARSILLRRLNSLRIWSLIFGFSCSLWKSWFEVNRIDHIVMIHSYSFAVWFLFSMTLSTLLCLSQVALMWIILI